MGSNGGEIQKSSAQEITEEVISERRLWTAVMVTAVEDWRSGTLRARRSAQKFLFEDERDFNDVCAGAGLDPASLRSKLLKIGRRINMHGPMGQSQPLFRPAAFSGDVPDREAFAGSSSNLAAFDAAHSAAPGQRQENQLAAA